MSDWQYRDRLAEQVREALGDFDDRTQPVIVLVAALRAAHEALLRRTQSLETALDQERADNERLRAFACDCEQVLGSDDEIQMLLNEHGLTDMDGVPTALLSGRGEGGNDG